MNTPSSFGCFLWLVAAGVALPGAALAQTDTPQAPQENWWKGLFRGERETPQDFPADDKDTTGILVLDSACMQQHLAPQQPAVVEAIWNVPDTLKSLDSLAKLDPAPLQGFRVQIYFGDLQEARAIRAAFNRAYPDVSSHLHPIDPNYAVTVGNFRDAWSAQRAVQSGSLGAWDNVLVIPSEIDLPDLK